MHALIYGLFILLTLSLTSAHQHDRNTKDEQRVHVEDETTSASKVTTPKEPHLEPMKSADLLPTFDPLVPDGLRQFILEKNQKHSAEHKLAERQEQVAPGGGGIPPAELPTQMPTVMDFQLSGKVVHYTQTFKATPVPWAGPKNGQIGLGTIKGQVGKPKNNGNG